MEVIKRLPGATASNTLDVPDHDVHDDTGDANHANDDDDDDGGGGGDKKAARSHSK